MTLPSSKTKKFKNKQQRVKNLGFGSKIDNHLASIAVFFQINMIGL
jgi:hypothetical protein